MSISRPFFAVGVLAAALAIASLPAQPALVLLRDGVTENAVLKASAKVEYAMDMQAGIWTLVRVDQRGVDVAITTYSPNGSKLSEFDPPNGAFGPEWVRLEASVQGQCRVEVQAIDETAREGRVELRLLSSGTRPTKPEATINAYLARYITTDPSGLAIRILRDGAPVCSKAFGMADLEHDITITTSSVFKVASVSKQFTAFAALLLERDRLLSMDNDVRKFIPELAEYPQVVTLLHLAQHTSGLRDMDDLLALRGTSPYHEVTHVEAVALL